MGIYLNPDNESFYMSYSEDIYVDKSLLIEYTNKKLNKANRFICVSRPRRFGKSTDANMLVAYYSKGCSSDSLFHHLKISESESYEKNLNQYNVINLNIQSFLSKRKNIDEMIDLLTRLILRELKMVYSDISFFDESDLALCLNDIYMFKNEQFIFIIDEWDCIFREYSKDKDSQKVYLDFLRNLLRDQKYVSLAYMTGILPIKKYGTHSALNVFDEISMVDPSSLSRFMGFTKEEVEDLCKQYNVSIKEMETWYDGYHLQDGVSIYSPRSVIKAITTKKFRNYWTSTETYESLKIYIDMNFDGLKDDIIKLLARKRVIINASKFQNDMTTFQSKDDIFTLLVHLGYLGYDVDTSEVYIPNNEVIESFVNSIEDSNWGAVSESLKNSMNLIQATFACDHEQVAEYIEKAHLETSVLQYNDENALAYTIYLAYIMARNDYTMVREFPSGKGFADIVFIPRYDKPAMIIELKYNQDVDTAIKQIKEKKYFFGVEHYLNNLLLVGISYDKKTKKHTCLIEKYENR